VITLPTFISGLFAYLGYGNEKQFFETLTEIATFFWFGHPEKTLSSRVAPNFTNRCRTPYTQKSPCKTTGISQMQRGYRILAYTHNMHLHGLVPSKGFLLMKRRKLHPGQLLKYLKQPVLYTRAGKQEVFSKTLVHHYCTKH
jgi:hypothetical protein